MLLLLLDDLTPEWFLGLYTGEKSEVDILTFFHLDMATGRRSASLDLADRPLSAWCHEWATTRKHVHTLKRHVCSSLIQ